jgi:hypothetical protein
MTAGRRRRDLPTITGNSVANYGIADNLVAGYAIVGNWVAGYGIVGNPVIGYALLVIPLPATVEISPNTCDCCMFQ